MPWCCLPWFLLAVAVRALVAARTVVPSHDVHYLWMGERIAAGDWVAPFSTAHHPLYGILNGLTLLALPQLSGVAAGQLVACTLGALAVVPLFLATRSLFGGRAAHVAAAFYVFGLWYSRHPAACLAEGPFYLLLAAVFWAVQRRSLVAGGILAGLAYATKPEGAGLLVVLAPWLWWSGSWQGALRFGVGFVVVAIWVPLGFAAQGPAFTLSPKLSFVVADGVGQERVNPLLHYLEHLLRALGTCFEGVGYLVFPLALWGIFTRGGSRVRDVRSVPVLLFLLQLLVIPILRSHHRFVSAYGMLLLPLAAAGLLDVLGRIGRSRSPEGWNRLPHLVVAVVLVLLPDLCRLPRAVNERRAVLVELGSVLRERLAGGGELATELARLQYFAGQKPGPPRRLHRREILARCDDPRGDVRVCVVIPPRTGVTAQDLASRGFTPMSLSPDLARQVAARKMLVYERGR